MAERNLPRDILLWEGDCWDCKMKILGLNFGKVNGNCKYFLNTALQAARTEHPEAEIEVVDTIKLKIGRCIGCGGCSRALESGKPIACVVKDDYEELSDKVLDADAIIVAAPVYVLAPVGQLKNFVDRFGPAHDMAYMMFENELRKDNGGELLHERNFKRHYVSYISVGGATTDHWVSMGLAGMQLFGMSLNMKQVDMVNVTGAYIPPMREKFADDCKKLGTRTANAVGKAYKDILWESDPGVCPACHCSIMMMDNTVTVCCPVCGIHGTVSVADGGLKYEFSEEEIGRGRMNLAGVIEHQAEIGRRDRYGDKYDEYVRKLSQIAAEK